MSSSSLIKWTVRNEIHTFCVRVPLLDHMPQDTGIILTKVNRFAWIIAKIKQFEATFAER